MSFPDGLEFRSVRTTEILKERNVYSMTRLALSRRKMLNAGSDRITLINGLRDAPVSQQRIASSP
jgi:hypothetical protein